MRVLLPLLAVPLLAQQSTDIHTLDREMALGAALAADAERNTPALDHPLVDAYVSRIAGRLMANLPEEPFPYRFRIVLADRREPGSFPGGHIVIPARFFLAVQEEAEFAAMLAHAIGHVALRHGIRPVSPAGATSRASQPLVFLGGWSGVHPDAGQPIAIPPGFVERQQAWELEADAFAVELAAASGLDASGLRRYIARIQAAPAAPSRHLRLARIDELLRVLPSTPAAPDPEFERVREVIRGVLGQASERRRPTLLR